MDFQWWRGGPMCPTQRAPVSACISCGLTEQRGRNWPAQLAAMARPEDRFVASPWRWTEMITLSLPGKAAAPRLPTLTKASSEVYVKRYNGITWEGVGGSDTGGGVSNSENWLLYQSPSPSLAVSSNTICVAWSEFEPFYAKCDPYSGDLPTSYCYPNGTGHPRVIMRCAHY